jgi:hypothetical protein
VGGCSLIDVIELSACSLTRRYLFFLFLFSITLFFYHVYLLIDESLYSSTSSSPLFANMALMT